MKLYIVDNLINKKMDENENFIKITFYEVRIKMNLSAKETEEFLHFARIKLENNYYNVYLTGEEYEYNGKKYVVEDNELMCAIKMKKENKNG